MCKFKAMIFAVLLVCSLSLTTIGWAAVVYDESVNGDLSNDDTTPTTLLFSLGSNQLLGSLDGNDRDDYFNFIVAPGQTVDSIILDSYTADGLSTVIEGWLLFIPAGPPAFSIAWGQNDIGNDLGLGMLQPGGYSFFLNEPGPFPDVDYSISFNVSGSPVPTPSAFLLMGTGLLGLVGYRKLTSRRC